MLRAQHVTGLGWVQIGDLHITDEHARDYQHFLATIEAIDTHLGGRIDFCVLPGGHAHDDTADQYALVQPAPPRARAS
jgi:hypothetical protein